MSITTRRGDDGQTDLMFGRRVAKTDPRVEACGAIDELNAALGVARVSCGRERARESIGKIQGELVVVMGELMTLEEDRERYFAEGYKAATAENTGRLTELAARLESESESPAKGWAFPGSKGSAGAAHLDFSRTVCRRAERSVAALAETNLLTNPEILRYLNRLSDALWLLARREEA